MPDDPAFIRTIAGNPDDDAPRLVYADYLEETGDPAKMARAEFIRVQVEKARLVPDTPRWTELWHRDSALLEWARDWRLELPAIEGVGYGGFVRGFVDSLSSSDQGLIEVLPLAVDSMPVRRVTVLSLTESLAESLANVMARTGPREVTIGLGHYRFSDSLIAFARRTAWPSLRKISVKRLVGQFPSIGPPFDKTWREAEKALWKAFGKRLTML